MEKARFTLPRGTCDAHCHVYGPGTAMPEIGLARLLAFHRQHGIDRAVIVQADPSAHEVTVEALEAGGGAYRGVTLVDDGTSDADLKALEARGFRGVRFTYTTRWGGPPEDALVRRTAERIRPLGWHVQIFIGPEDLAAKAPLFSALPVPVVIDHMGRPPADAGLAQPAFATLLELLKRDHLWVKLSGCDRISKAGAPFTDGVPFAKAALAAAPDRALWGTDWPHPNNHWNPDDADLIDLVPLIAPEEAARQRLLIDNPARLYRF